MKKRIMSILLLSLMIAPLVMAVAPINGANSKLRTEFTVQEDLMEAKNTMVCEVIKKDEENNIKNDFDVAVKEMKKEMEEIESIADKKEWFVAYKDIIEKYSYILDPPETIYDYFAEDELDLFFRVVQAEVGDEYSFTQKCNVASVILNRIQHDRFGNSIFEILTPDQFATISNGRYKRVKISETTILACEYVFEIENTMKNALFFDSDGSLQYEFIANDGAHNFYNIKGE